MTEAVKNLGLWLLRLLPANPILVRVVHGGSRRIRHLWARAIFLGILFLVMLVSMLRSQSGAGSGLGELAITSSRTFAAISIVQLAMVCFLSPIFTAAAITQEKDAQTYNILLTTPLSNAQIVLGSLASRLFFVITLLLAGFPVFCITLLFGGVTLSEIVLSFALAATTATLTGSLAIAISIIQMGTRRTIFSFYLMIALYLAAVWWAGQWNGTAVPEATVNPGWKKVSWLAAFHPFLSLWVALDLTRPPAYGAVAHYGWPWNLLAAYPHFCYLFITLAVSLALVTLSVFFVRRVTKQGETTLAQRFRALFRRDDFQGERRRKPHTVWRNPVAWREAVTRASATSRGLTRYGLLGGGVVMAAILLAFYHEGTQLTPALTRSWLLGLIMIEFAVVLLVATNTAATAITREKEADTMDLLLVTPLTSRYIVWGKLRGLVSYTIPLIAVPLITLTLFVTHDVVSGRPQPIVYPEGILELGVLLVIYSAFACILGLQSSLKSRRTMKAVLSAVGVMIVACLALTACGFAVINADASQHLGPLMAPFTPFTSIAMVVDPYFTLRTTQIKNPGHLRLLSLTGTVAAAAVYGMVVLAMYRNMVRHFDMTIRKQYV